jgi:hypothetical protein
LDPQNGYGIGAGYATGTTTTQSEQALQFYKAVIDSGVAASNLLLTGHSLGGGLAGFVSALTGTNARLFDQMSFQEAASDFIQLINGSLPTSLASTLWPYLFQPYTNADILTAQQRAALIYSGAYPTAANFSQITSSYVPDDTFDYDYNLPGLIRDTSLIPTPVQYALPADVDLT